jgi:hypothetical protein
VHRAGWQKRLAPALIQLATHLRDERPRLQHLLHLLDSGVDKGLQPSRLQLLMAETPGGCTPCRLAKESCPGPHARDDATSGHDSNVLRLSSDLIGPVEPRGYDGTRYLIGFTKEFINWLDMQDFKDKHTTRRLHLDNDTFIQDHEL